MEIPLSRLQREIIIGSILGDGCIEFSGFHGNGRLDYRPKDHYAFILNTDAFSVKDVNRIREALNNNFGIISTVQHSLCRGKKYPKLYIGKKGRDRFLKAVKPYILNCFPHKLPPLL